MAQDGSRWLKMAQDGSSVMCCFNMLELRLPSGKIEKDHERSIDREISNQGWNMLDNMLDNMWRRCQISPDHLFAARQMRDCLSCFAANRFRPIEAWDDLMCWTRKVGNFAPLDCHYTYYWYLLDSIGVQFERNDFPSSSRLSLCGLESKDQATSYRNFSQCFRCQLLIWKVEDLPSSDIFHANNVRDLA